MQGRFVTDPQAPVVARVAGMDLEQRYAAIGEGPTNHVCTGNSAYRAEALHKAGLFDESFGYGYDNDMSYRLMHAGYALRFCPGAKSVHRWRETLRGYLVQQYGQGYGRLDIVWKHPGWVAGDAVSPSMMMAHAPLMAAAMASGVASLLLRAAGLPWRQAAALAGVIVAGLALERLVAGVRAAIRHRDAARACCLSRCTCCATPPWALAIVAWPALLGLALSALARPLRAAPGNPPPARRVPARRGLLRTGSSAARPDPPVAARIAASHRRRPRFRGVPRRTWVAGALSICPQAGEGPEDKWKRPGQDPPRPTKRAPSQPRVFCILAARRP